MKKNQTFWDEYKDQIGYVIVSGLFILITGIYAFLQNDLVSLIIFLYLVGDGVYKVNAYYQGKSRMRKEVEAISYRVKHAGETVFNHLPIGIILYNEDNEITWFNPYAKRVFADELLGSKLENINLFLYESIIKGEASFEIKLDENTYSFQHDKDERLLYLTDHTDYANLNEQYINEKPVVGLLIMDNYDEVIHNLNEQEKSEMYGKIVSMIMQWADQHDIFVRSTAVDRFVLMFSNEVLQQLRQNKFTIIDKIRELAKENDVLLTISMGIATGYEDYAELGQRANYMLDLALSRGGDQVAIKIASEDKFLFYGGKTNPVEKRNRVRARVNAQAYERLVRDSDRVIIMGHRFPDVDAIGASIGLLRMSAASKKEAYIVLKQSELDKTAENFVQAIKNDEKLKNHFISSETALELLTKNTLLVVADTQDPKLVIEPLLVSKAKKIAVFDHHRRGVETIDSVLSFTEPYASSTVELVVDMFDYYSQKIRMTQLEASIMLAGIIVDTRRFSYHTGRRTYETAAILKQHGAEEKVVQQLLRTPLENYYSKAHLIEKSEIFKESFIIAPADDDMVLEKVQIAQAADELLNVQNIKASFVISKINEDTIGISARSLGDINVQMIMEQLGGGGHLNNAATQMKNVTIQQAVLKLKEVIVLECEESGE
ncbi:MAG TPA: RNA-binding protein [Firmicutes bacterium]|nr:RNA-binding protein [Bacillota bacterium]